EDVGQPLQIGVVTDRMHAVGGEAAVRPEQATVLGPCKVIPREFPQISCVSIDVALPPALRADHPNGLRNGTAASVEHTAGHLLAELLAPSTDTIVALRGGERWVERYEAASIGEPAATPDGLGGLRDG